MPEPDCFLLDRISAGTRNFTSGKSRVYVLARPGAAAKRSFKMVLLPRDAMHKRGYSRHAVSDRPSVCLSVCPSVTFVDHVKTNKHIFEICSPPGSHTSLVFPYQTGWRHSDGNFPITGRRMHVWYRQKSRFWSNSWLSKIAGHAKCQNIYRRRS